MGGDIIPQPQCKKEKRESLWKLKISDILVIALAFLTLLVACLTLWVAHYEGSTSDLQQKELDKMQIEILKADTQIQQLKNIDTVLLSSLKTQQNELSYIARAYFRASLDSIAQYANDSAACDFTKNELDNISMKALLSVGEFTVDGLRDSIQMVIDILNIANTKNLYFKRHELERQLWVALQHSLIQLGKELGVGLAKNVSMGDDPRKFVAELGELQKLLGEPATPSSIEEFKKTVYNLYHPIND
jgi:adenosyl cobinamide kinase/adenosyl cobinamide phosphate guanylyltransferase